MGARQSKRSVDITTGKEVCIEGSEVAAGAGGEGKLERIEDLDTLKPQLNGDASHQEQQISEKEKKMQEEDEAQENEKDNSNEKEIILTPVTVNGSGEGEAAAKDGENTPESEANKKPKKEKVKKKWSIRSISFSKKDKQKPAKKEEVNGERDKVPEEVAEVAPVPASEAVDVKVEVPVVEAEITKCDDSERANEKAPETPVTEPLTNCSSAPESPKEEEIRQNGDSPSVEEKPIIAEKLPEMEAKAPESPKAEEKPLVSEVDALPVNGLKIEESVQEEVKAPVEVEVPPPVVVAEKIEEVTACEKVPEPIEEKPAVIADAEVCVEKGHSEAVGSVEVNPPPLPSSPPPSSLTMFAESTMAPLVDTQNVENLPVDVEASTSPVSPPAFVTELRDDVQSSQNDSSAQLVCEITPVTNLPTALSNNYALGECLPPLPISEIIVESSNVPTTEASIPSVEDVVVPTSVKDNIVAETGGLSPSVENVAVVSSNEIIVPDSSEIIPSPALDSFTEIPSLLTKSGIVTEEIIQAVEDNSAVQSSPDLPEVSDVKAELDISLNAEDPQIPDPVEKIATPEELPVPTPISPQDIPLPSSDEIEKSLATDTDVILPINDVPASVDSSLPSSINATDSPVLQRALSDLDVSETTVAEPPSDSFPPPPPESCPESMTELSVSESLPPPLSEHSLPDTVVNSPTSEIVDLLIKDEVLQKDIEIADAKDLQEQDVETKAEEQVKEAVDVPPIQEIVADTKSSPVVQPSGDAAIAEQVKQPINTPQVEQVSAVADVPAAAAEVVASESAPTVDSAAE